VEFRWNDWNIQHVAEHGVDLDEAEGVVRDAEPPWPLFRGDERFLVWGLGRGDQPLQVVFVLDPDDTAYIIHARPLTEKEKRRYRRRRR
jgi:uncharacterized DUF497 family protein